VDGTSLYTGYFASRGVDPLGLSNSDPIGDLLGCANSVLHPDINLKSTDGQSPAGCGQYAFRKAIGGSVITPWTGTLGVTVIMAPLNELGETIVQKIGLAVLEQLPNQVATVEMSEDDFLQALQDALGGELDSEEWELVKAAFKRMQKQLIESKKGNCRVQVIESSFADTGGGSESVKCTVVICADIDYGLPIIGTSESSHKQIEMHSTPIDCNLFLKKYLCHGIRKLHLPGKRVLKISLRMKHWTAFTKRCKHGRNLWSRHKLIDSVYVWRQPTEDIDQLHVLHRFRTCLRNSRISDDDRQRLCS